MYELQSGYYWLLGSMLMNMSNSESSKRNLHKTKPCVGCWELSAQRLSGKIRALCPWRAVSSPGFTNSVSAASMQDVTIAHRGDWVHCYCWRKAVVLGLRTTLGLTQLLFSGHFRLTDKGWIYYTIPHDAYLPFLSFDAVITTIQYKASKSTLL